MDKAYKFIFYKFYAFSDYFEINTDDTNEIYAGINTIAFLWLNVLSINLLVERLTKNKFSNYFTAFLQLAIIAVFVYYKSIYDRKYLSDNTLFVTDNKPRGLMGTILFSLYCLVSFVVFWYLYIF